MIDGYFRSDVIIKISETSGNSSLLPYRQYLHLYFIFTFSAPEESSWNLRLEIQICIISIERQEITVITRYGTFSKTSL